MNVHYDPITGEIAMWDYTLPHDSTESHLADNVVANIPDQDIDHKTQKMDVIAVRVVSKTGREKAEALLPTIYELKHAIAYELHHTDGYAVPDRPMSDAKRAEWKKHRQELRDLSKLKGGPAEMVRAWAMRPDGTDAIEHLRQRLPSKAGKG